MDFKYRPLGFKVRAGEGDRNAIIASVDDETNDAILIGTQIMEINDRNCVDVAFDGITHWLTTKDLPLTIVFQRPPGVTFNFKFTLTFEQIESNISNTFRLFGIFFFFENKNGLKTI